MVSVLPICFELAERRRRKVKCGSCNPPIIQARQTDLAVITRLRSTKFTVGGDGLGEQVVSTILVVCATYRDRREIPALADTDQHRLLFHDYASLALEDLVADEPPEGITIDDPEAEIEHILTICEKENVDAVISSDDYPGTALASIAARRLGLSGVSPAANLLCQHKYYSRQIQYQATPEAVPNFQILDVRPDADPVLRIAFPFFVKPVKSFFSVGAQRVDSIDQLAAIKHRWASLASFFPPFEVLLKKYAGLSVGTKFLLAEELLEGLQATLEGYVYQGEIHLMGIVDSVMFPNTIAFKRFEYPSSLPESVQSRMFSLARKLMRQSDFDSGMFNVEFIYNPRADTIHVVEINPRMSSQFADLFEKVDGINSYSVLLDLAFGEEPQISKGEGRYPVAASCVLRTFENKRVMKLPGDDEIGQLQLHHPDIRIEVLATEGTRLSQQMQDGQSYRYGIINIGGGSMREILNIYEECLRKLTFVFEPVAPYEPRDIRLANVERQSRADEFAQHP